jgi:hypothetical protein
MRHDWQRTDPIRLLWRRVLLLVLFLVLLAAAWALWGIWGKQQESLAMRRSAEGHLHDLQGQYAALQDKVDGLKTERGQEGVLRDTYDVGKPGEGLIVIVDDKSAAAQASSTTQHTKPWWRFW